MKAKEKKSYQDWCVDTLVYILQNRNAYRGQFKDQGYKYAIDAIIKHYSSMYFCSSPDIAQRGKEHVNLWWDHLSNERCELMFKSVLMSVGARRMVLDKGFTIGRAKESLHWEHIVPCARVLKDLCGLSVVNEASVRQCFRHNKLVLILKTEASVLDGAGCRFEQRDLDFVKKFWPEEYALAEACRQDRPKKGGTALLRLARLHNSGIEFCTYDDERELPPTEWLEYLNDSTYILGADDL